MKVIEKEENVEENKHCVLVKMLHDESVTCGF